MTVEGTFWEIKHVFVKDQWKVVLFLEKYPCKLTKITSPLKYTPTIFSDFSH